MSYELCTYTIHNDAESGGHRTASRFLNGLDLRPARHSVNLDPRDPIYTMIADCRRDYKVEVAEALL